MTRRILEGWAELSIPLITACAGSWTETISDPAPHELQPPTSSRPQVYRGCFPAVVLDLKLNVLTFIERAQAGALDSRDVHEYISAAASRLDKAIAFLRVEPFHRAGRHCRISELTI